MIFEVNDLKIKGETSFGGTPRSFDWVLNFEGASQELVEHLLRAAVRNALQSIVRGNAESLPTTGVIVLKDVLRMRSPNGVKKVPVVSKKSSLSTAAKVLEGMTLQEKIAFLREQGIDLSELVQS